MPCGEAFVVWRGVSGELMARSLVLGGDSMLYKDDEDLDSPSEVHLHGDMTILFCIFYYMHVGNKNEFYFIFSSGFIPLTFCSNVTLVECHLYCIRLGKVDRFFLSMGNLLA